MTLLHLVASHLKRKKVRTVLTLLSIMIAFFLFGYLGALRQAFTAGVNVAGEDRLVVRHRVSIIQMLPESYRARTLRIPGVKAATFAIWFGGIYQEPKNFFPQFPVEPEAYLEMYPELVLPADQKQAWLATRTGAIVGRSTADKFGFKVGDRVPIQATIWSKKDGGRTWDFDIVGIYDGKTKETETTTFLFRYDFFDETRAFGEGTIGWFIIRVADRLGAEQVARAVDTEFANSPYETKTETEKAFVQSFANQVGNIGAIVTVVLSAVFFTILLVAGNTMAQGVRERTGELAVLKALGFSDARVLVLVLLESLFLAFAGGLAGLSLAMTHVHFAGDPTGGGFPVFYIPARQVLLGLVVMAVLGLAAGILPAVAAGRLRIAHAMRRT